MYIVIYVIIISQPQIDLSSTHKKYYNINQQLSYIFPYLRCYKYE